MGVAWGQRRAVNEVELLEWRKGCQVFVCILVQCGFSGIVCGLPVDFRWPVNTLLRVGVQDGGAVGVAWSFFFGLAFGPLRAFIEHFRL